MYYTYYSPKECSDGNEEQRIRVNSDLSAKTVETNLSADNLYVGTNDAIGICVLHGVVCRKHCEFSIFS